MKKIELSEELKKKIELHFSKELNAEKVMYYPLSQTTYKEESYTLLIGMDAKKPNGENVSVVLSGKGKFENAKEFRSRLKDDIFSEMLEEVKPFKRPLVTITPNVNDLILNICDSFGEKLMVSIPPHPERNIDIYFLADSTGSMDSALNNVKTNINSIINALPYANIAYGVGDYKDFDSSDPYCFQNRLSLTAGNNASVISSVNSLTANGGGDADEGQLFALHQLADASNTVGWRANATKIIVWFGDFPGHDPICASLTGFANDITESTVINDLQAMGIKVLAASIGSYGLDFTPYDTYSTCPNASSGAGQATRITSGTGGALLSNINAAQLSTAIINLINNSLQTIGNVSLVPTGAIKPFVCSINPKHGYNNLDASVAHNLEFVVCFKGSKLCGRRDQFYTGTFDVVIDGTVVTAKKVRIEVPACHSKGKCGCSGCD